MPTKKPPPKLLPETKQVLRAAKLFVSKPERKRLALLVEAVEDLPEEQYLEDDEGEEEE